MGPLALVASLGALAGLVLLVRADGARDAVLSTAIVTVVIPVASQPSPGPLPLAFREVAGLLACWLIWTAARDTTRLLGRLPLGGTAEAAFVVAAFGVGVFAGPGPLTLEQGDALVGSQLARTEAATALALGLAAVELLVFGNDAIRLAVGGVLGLLAADLAARALAAPAAEPRDLALGIALVAIAAAAARIARTVHRVRGDLELAPRAHGPVGG